jgi:tRNA/rRNA methyltransferase
MMQHDTGMECQPVIILVRPQLGENIGMAARAMRNFGLLTLRIVAPRDGFEPEGPVFSNALAAASGADSLVRAATLHASLDEAIADLNSAIATTARSRAQGKPVEAPATAMPAVFRHAQAGQRIGLVFGPERTGLANDEIAICDRVLSIPVDPDFSSLNLAQAVLVVAYEWKKAQLGAETGFAEAPRELARRASIASFFSFLDASLAETGYFRPEEKRPLMMTNLQNIMHRMQMSEQDLRSLRGAFEALFHAGRVKKQKRAEILGSRTGEAGS